MKLGREFMNKAKQSKVDAIRVSCKAKLENESGILRSKPIYELLTKSTNSEESFKNTIAKIEQTSAPSTPATAKKTSASCCSLSQWTVIVIAVILAFMIPVLSICIIEHVSK